MPRLKSKSNILYPDVSVNVCVGDDALTCENAKDLLGWRSEDRHTKFYDDYLFKDDTGGKVRCNNNHKNRPFDEGWSRHIAQDILNKRWKLNLETIIIGCFGNVLSGQHRLIALVLANQLWERYEHWQEVWESPPTIETLVAFGADESNESTRTLDNVKPRTLGDVLFTTDVFSQHRPKDRKRLTRMIDYAVRFLWKRTGASNNPFLPRRTHSEALEFIANHPKISECVNHIYNEDCNGSISKYISLGYASGLMYLMACSKSKRSKYQDNGFTEDSLDTSMWSTSASFWSDISGGKSLSRLRISLKKAMDDEETVRIDERVALITKSWLAYSSGRPPSKSDCTLKYSRDDDGVRVLDENPRVGGIDIG